VTSIAESARESVGPAWARLLLLSSGLALFASQTPYPWGGLWVGVPAAVAVSLLVTWRFGLRGAVLPVALFGGAFALAGLDSLWVWWIPTAALTGAWMGMREEGGGIGAGEQAWMLAPLLALAAALPWARHYPDLIAGVDRELRAGDSQFLELCRQLGYTGERFANMQKTVADNARLQQEALPHLLPTALFVWSALLVAAGRALSGRLARVLRWPRLSRAQLRAWRLPDPVLWVFIAGLALLVSPWSAWAPTGWTLLINSGLAYCVQGIAVVESTLLARGVPPSIIVLTLLFVFAIAMPVFVLATAAVGLSDVWLDYRRLEPVPEGDSTQE
jgi:Predicted membrane protein (DUF2232)